MTEEVEVTLVELERLANLLYFLHEARQLPETGFIRLVAVRRSELIVVVVFDPGAWQITVERLEVLVSHPWSAMEEQDLDPRIVADALGPDVERALRCLNRDESDTARENIVAAG